MGLFWRLGYNIVTTLLQVVEKAAGDSWAEEFGGSTAAAAAGPSSAWSTEFAAQQQQQQQQQQQPGYKRDWADEFAAGVANINLDDAATEEQMEAAWAAMGTSFICNMLANMLTDNNHRLVHICRLAQMRKRRLNKYHHGVKHLDYLLPRSSIKAAAVDNIRPVQCQSQCADCVT
jgi:hypothetical protein